MTVQLDFEVGDETQIAMIDTGSAPTKLPMKFFDRLGLKADSPGIQRKKFKTMANFETEAFLAEIPGKIRLKQAPHLKNGAAPVRFDHSLRMGSVGGDFFMDKVVTFDLARKRIIIAR